MRALAPSARRDDDDEAATACGPGDGARPSALVRVLLAAFAAGLAANDLVVRSLGAGTAASLVSSVLAGSPLLLAAGWQTIRTGRLRPSSGPLQCLAILVGWALLGVGWAVDFDALRSSLVTLAQLLVMVWLGWQALRSIGDVRAALVGYVVGCGVVVAAGWAQYRAGVAYVAAGADGVWGPARFAAPGFDPNEMGVTLALGLPMAAYLAFSGGRWPRWLTLAYVPVGVLGIALSGSRGAFLTALVAVSCGLAWMSRRGPLALAASLSAVVAGGALAMASVQGETLTRLLSLTDELSGSLGDRRAIWLAGWEALQDNPLAGAGLGNFPLAVSPYLFDAAPHNTPLQVAVELGALGVALFYGAQVLVALRATRSAPDEKALVWALLLTAFVGSLSLGMALRKTTWFIVLVAASLSDHSPARGEEGERSAERPGGTS